MCTPLAQRRLALCPTDEGQCLASLAGSSLAVLTLFAMFLLCSCGGVAPADEYAVPGAPSASDVPRDGVRPPAVAGAFYPADPVELQAAVDDLLHEATQGSEAPIALVVPHAAYVYSGPVAAAAFKQIQGREYDAVVLLGTNHYAAGFEKNAIWPTGAYSTPLGLVPIDESLARELLEADPTNIVADSSVQLAEHSIEVELPFLKRVRVEGGFVPILVGTPSLQNSRALAAALVKVLSGRRALIVASSDLSHYPAYQDALAVDTDSLLAICSTDPEAVLANDAMWMSLRVSNLACTMCGEGPVLTAMMAASGLGANRAALLRYQNSGDVPGTDRGRVVGYAALMWWKMDGAQVGDIEKESLLSAARQALRSTLTRVDIEDWPNQTPALARRQGAFVTLKQQGKLRGCIGTVWATKPLGLTVRDMAVAAGTQDPRFAPLTVDELDGLEIEVSVLSPLAYVKEPEDIQVGRDGVYITVGNKSAVFLPQVAVEQGWDRETLLGQLCLKAGLPEDAWQRGGLLYRFQAEVFSDGN